MKILSLVLGIFLYHSAKAQPLDSATLLQLKAPAVYQVEIKTTSGDITIEVNKEWAPLAADRFYQLVKSNFFSGNRLFRSNKKYLQFGIGGDSSINAFWERHPIADEPVKLKNIAGAISFATSGPDARTTSVYFNKIDNPKLDTIQNGTAFPAFGKIIKGIELLASIENKYADSVVFKEWDAMTAKGHAYTDKVFPGLERIISMRIIDTQRKNLQRMVTGSLKKE